MAPTNSEPPDRPRMTIRISRDSGRTWGPTREYREADCPLPFPFSLPVWPPCTCPRHRKGSEISR